MRCVAGSIYRPGEGLEDGWLVIDAGRVIEEGTGKPPRAPDVTGVFIPAPVDAHTHVGDRVGRGLPLAGRALDDVVKPPHGLKHRLLRETPRDALVDGMRAAIAELAGAQVRAFVDFREQGLDGTRMLREAAADAPVEAIVMARCADAWDDAEADAVAAEADGIGLSGLGDVASDVPERAARAARKHGKCFALHLSEAAGEDVGRALDLAPDFLVHMCAATTDDLAAVAQARVPIVLCPRSNALFGRAPDAPAMLEAGIPLALGSDNAMFHPLDPLLDAALLAQRHLRAPATTWLDLAIAGGARVADGVGARSWLRRGDPGAFRVLTSAEARTFLGKGSSRGQGSPPS